MSRELATDTCKGRQERGLPVSDGYSRHQIRKYSPCGRGEFVRFPQRNAIEPRLPEVVCGRKRSPAWPVEKTRNLSSCCSFFISFCLELGDVLSKVGLRQNDGYLWL